MLLYNTEKCSDHDFLQLQLKNYLGGGDRLAPEAERRREQANKKTEHLHKVSTPCLDGHNFKKEELDTVGELSDVCSQIVLKCLYFARIGRPDTLWSVNKLARSVIQWTGACDKRQARLISYINHTNDYRQYCHVGNTVEHCRLGLFQDSDFSGGFEHSKSISGRISCIFGSRTFSKNQTSMSHASTESEIILLDAGLRQDGIPALDLWDVVIEVLHSPDTNTPTTQNNSANEGRVKELRETAASTSNAKSRKESNQNDDQLANPDHVATNANFCQCNAQLCIFEDNDAVIKMIIKRRSPIMRHVLCVP